MNDLWDIMKTFVESQQDCSLSDEEFYGYLEGNPSLFGVVTAARREGNVGTGLLDVNFPETIDTNQGDNVHLVNELKALALWLIVAGRKFCFTIFEMGTIDETKKVKDFTFPTTLPKDLASCEDIDKRQKSLRRFCKKVGGIDIASGLIRQTYASTGSQIKTAKRLSKQFRMKISQNMISRWMLYLHIECKPQLGGRKMPFKKNLRKVDEILRRKVRMSLSSYVRQERKQGVLQADIIRKIKTFTRIELSSGSMSHLCKRLKVS